MTEIKQKETKGSNMTEKVCDHPELSYDDRLSGPVRIYKCMKCGCIAIGRDHQWFLPDVFLSAIRRYADARQWPLVQEAKENEDERNA